MTDERSAPLPGDLAAMARELEETKAAQRTSLVAIDNATSLIAALRAEVARLRGEEALWRKLLWLRHHATTAGLYGDDGEMQCGQCMIDFKRNAPSQIEARFWQINKPILDAARSALSAPAEEPTT